MNPETQSSRPGPTVKHPGPHPKLPQSLQRRIAVAIYILLDATGSMAAEIAGVVKALLGFVKILRKSDLDPVLGLIVFRDEPYGEKPLVLPLGASPDGICDVLRATRATGGDDDPESSYPAIMRAVESVKSCGSEVKRIFLHITDAPPHDPEQGHTSDTVLQALKQHRIVFFACTPAIEPYTLFANVTGGTLFPLQPDMNAEAFRDVLLAVADQTVKTVRRDGPALTEEMRALLKGATQK